MQELYAQIISKVLGIWRHRWIALLIAWVVALGGWAFVWQMPESYVGSARVYVDTNSVLRPLMRGLTVDPNTNQRVAMMSQTLLSRPNLERIARMTDLDLKAETPEKMDRLIKSMESSISIAGTRGNDSLYAIKVTDRDRDVARQIAQSLITVFIETALSGKRSDSTGAQTFLSQQIQESEERLISAEQRLAKFKQGNVGVLPGERGDYYARLEQARYDLEWATLELEEVERRGDELERQLDGEAPLDNIRLPVDDRIDVLRLEMDSLLTRYTEKHPQVVRLQTLVEELETQRSLEMAALRDDPRAARSMSSSSRGTTISVFDGIRSMLAETEAQRAELQVRVGEYQKRVDDLGGKVNLIPNIEAQLTQLMRDYDVIASQHQQLLQRREAARLSGDVESNADDVSFRVVDPPYVPREPSEPNKLMLNAVVLVLALGVGGGFAFLLALLNPIVTDPRMLAQATGLPLLGTVTWNKTAAEDRRASWRFAGFAACTVMLLCVFATVMLLPTLELI